MISEFPLFVFTILGGMAAGAYVFVSFVPMRKSARPWAFPALVLVLLAISGIALLTHLGRPALVLNAFKNPTSGITLEGFATMLFGVLVVVDFVLALMKKQSRVVHVLAAIAGVLLLLAMGYAYASFAGVVVWGTWQTYLLFVFGGLAMGATLAAFFTDGGYGNATLAIATMVALVLGIISIALVGAVFAGNGYEPAAFIVGAVLVALAACVAWYARKKGDSTVFVAGAFALAFIGVAVARYFFYAVV